MQISSFHSLCSSHDRAEPQVFKIRFEDWEDVLRVDFTRTPEMLEKRDKEMVSWSGELLVNAANISVEPDYIGPESSTLIGVQ